MRYESTSQNNLASRTRCSAAGGLSILRRLTYHHCLLRWPRVNKHKVIKVGIPRNSRYLNDTEGRYSNTVLYCTVVGDNLTDRSMGIVQYVQNKIWTWSFNDSLCIEFDAAALVMRILADHAAHSCTTFHTPDSAPEPTYLAEHPRPRSRRRRRLGPGHVVSQRRGGQQCVDLVG